MSIRNLLHLNHSATKENICFTTKLQNPNISVKLKLQAFYFFHDKVLVLNKFQSNISISNDNTTKKHCPFRNTVNVLLYIPFVFSFVSAAKEWKKKTLNVNDSIPPKEVPVTKSVVIIKLIGQVVIKVLYWGVNSPPCKMPFEAQKNAKEPLYSPLWFAIVIATLTVWTTGTTSN